MWSLFKTKKNDTTQHTSNEVSASVTVEDQEQKEKSIVNETEIKTKLFLHPAVVVSQQEKYVYQYQHQLLPALQPNQISISGYDKIVFNDAVIIEGFIQNTLPSKIRFEDVVLLVMDSNERILARKVYDFHTLGELPSSSAMPWRFLFESSDIQVELSEWEDDWKLAFELRKQRPHQEQLELELSWEERMTEEELLNLRNQVSTLPQLKPDEVNLFGLKMEKVDANKLAITLLVRNGTDKKIELNQLPLQLESGEGNILASGVFHLNEFSVSPFSCKPWTFIFPESLVQQMPEDFSSWKVAVPSNN